MTLDDALDLLNALAPDDPAAAHEEAEAVLLEWLKSNGHRGLAEAFERAKVRCQWWYD